MSNDAAIAAVTATLTNMIQRAVSVDAAVAGGKVTARPPDRARQSTTGNQINLFLYRTSIDPAWRNQDPPTIRSGESAQPPLPLVLSYLVTGYGDNDDEVLGHRLLGIAMSVLHDKPLLSRNEIRASLAGSDLEVQFERVRITPHPIPLDEISRMWATFGTGYRLSVSYDAAVVLIDSVRPVLAPPPVLARGPGDAGPAVLGSLTPGVEVVVPPHGQGAARPGDTVTLVGRNLADVTAIQVTGLRIAAPSVIAPVAVTATAISVQIPTPPTLPAGTVALAALSPAPLGAQLLSNAAPLALAPTIVSRAPLKAKRDAAGNATVKVKCAPPIEPGQTIALIVGDQVVAGTVGPASSPPRAELSFPLAGMAPSTYTLRLRVDSVDSIPLAAPANPDEPLALDFDTAQTLVLS